MRAGATHLSFDQVERLQRLIAFRPDDFAEKLPDTEGVSMLHLTKQELSDKKQKALDNDSLRTKLAQTQVYLSILEKEYEGMQQELSKTSKKVNNGLTVSQIEDFEGLNKERDNRQKGLKIAKQLLDKTAPVIGIAFVSGEKGVLITEVKPGEPGAAASLKVNDVVVAIGGSRTTTKLDFYRAVENVLPGQEMIFQVIKQETERITNVSVTMGARGLPLDMVCLARKVLNNPRIEDDYARLLRQNEIFVTGQKIDARKTKKLQIIRDKS